MTARPPGVDYAIVGHAAIIVIVAGGAVPREVRSGRVALTQVVRARIVVVRRNTHTRRKARIAVGGHAPTEKLCWTKVGRLRVGYCVSRCIGQL